MSHLIWIDAKGDVCSGDTIRFVERVFNKFGSEKMILLGKRTVIAKVLSESYGVQAQQHTFTLEVISSDGHEAIPTGKTIKRKGRNIYRFGALRLRWDRERLRLLALDEKHERGKKARVARWQRQSNLHRCQKGRKH